VRRSVPRFGAKSAAERPDPKSWPLSAADTKELARLVRKHGRDTIVSAAKEVPVRGRGRPPNGDQAYFERVALAYSGPARIATAEGSTAADAAIRQVVSGANNCAPIFCALQRLCQATASGYVTQQTSLNA
jgi:hypothetical protein